MATNMHDVCTSQKTIAIVGGVAAGASTAARLRRNCESCHIVMYERGSYVSFANCGLPYYVGGIIKERNELFVSNATELKERFNIDVHTRTDVLSFDTSAKTVTVKNLETGEVRTDKYDELVLAPGAKPIIPPFPGVDLPGIFTIRSVPDVDKVVSWIEHHHETNKAVIVGGGFIGLEMAENLQHLKKMTTIVDMEDQVLAPMDREMVTYVEGALKEHGVGLHLGDAVSSFSQKDNSEILLVTTKSGAVLEADVVILAIGVTADADIAKNAGIELGARGAIVVDENMRTSAPNVWAAGDAVQKHHQVLNVDMPFYMAGPANRQGRVVADNIIGIPHKFEGFLGTAICGIFGLQAAMTGVPEKTLVRSGKIQGKDYDVVYLHPLDHAEYYPDANRVHMKLIFSVPDGKILGAQASGLKGCERRIDTISMAMHFKGTIHDLEEAELCYSPQYGSAKDPVNLAGMLAYNTLNKHTRNVYWKDIKAGQTKGVILDVREAEELEKEGAVESAVNIPMSVLRTRLDEISKEKPVWVFCRTGVRGHTVTRMLMQLGYDAWNVSGGFCSYISQPIPVSH